MAIDPSLALRRRSVVLYGGHPSTDESLCRDWYVVGGDLHVAGKKFQENLAAQVSSDA